MADETIRIYGLRGLQRALRKVDRDLVKELNRELKAAADLVRQDASARFTAVNAATAAGFRPRARTGTAVVEQSRKRTTGKRPDFGSLQMRLALLPALESKSGEVERAIEAMLDRLGSEGGF